MLHGFLFLSALTDHVDDGGGRNEPETDEDYERDAEIR